MKKSYVSAVALTAAAALVLSGCSAGGDEASVESTTIKVAYQKFGAFIQVDNHMKAMKEAFEAENEGLTVELVPIEGQENDYATKLALMNQSPATAPDVMYEDTFRVQSDSDAGYLAPLDEYTEGWSDWDSFYDNAKSAGLGSDGLTYGIPMGTDTRAIWYNKDLFAQAGLEVPFDPQTWEDVLDAAATIKAEIPDVMPLNVYSGKAQGEAASMQGFEMLLYGTSDSLYDADDQKWMTGSDGFVDSLGFIEDVYQGDLGPTPEQALDKNVGNLVLGEWLPQGELAMAVDGSWISGTWLETGTAPWPEWNDVMGQAAMPTQTGDAPGATSMSGGWTLAMGSGAQNKDAAWEFIALALNKDNAQSYDIAASQIAVRSDVSEDADYQAANPTFGFFSEIVKFTHFRPATSDYAQVSSAITVAMESVMTGQQSPEEAAAVYDDTVIGIIGEDGTASVK